MRIRVVEFRHGGGAEGPLVAFWAQTEKDLYEVRIYPDGQSFWVSDWLVPALPVNKTTKALLRFVEKHKAKARAALGERYGSPGHRKLSWTLEIASLLTEGEEP